MKVKIKKLHPDAIIPKYQTANASGLDIHSLEDAVIWSGTTRGIRTGLSCEVPENYEIQIRPRSGLTLKTPLRVANSPGTIDADYRGEIIILLQNTDSERYNTPIEYYTIKKGDRIAQMVVCPIIKAELEEVTELSNSERGEGGFGSSGS